MVDRRRSVKQQHERAVVQDFLAWWNARRGTQFKVIAEPNPPEAIIRSARATRWVEVTDAFWTEAGRKTCTPTRRRARRTSRLGQVPLSKWMDRSLLVLCRSS